MCRKIRYDGESWKLFGFRSELNKAIAFVMALHLESKHDSLSVCIDRCFF